MLRRTREVTVFVNSFQNSNLSSRQKLGEIEGEKTEMEVEVSGSGTRTEICKRLHPVALPGLLVVNPGWLEITHRALRDWREEV